MKCPSLASVRRCSKSFTLSAPYMVRLAIPDLDIRKGPGKSCPKTGKFTGVGAFNIVEEKKIKKQLEKDGDLTAMGKSLWHYATISHILKNRLYCGELEYRKEYVPDYLEQKRAKNNGELGRIIMEGKHQPTVTKGEFERVQRMLEEKTHRRRSGGKIKAFIRMTSGAGSCGASADTLSQRPDGTPSQGNSPPTPTSAMNRPGRGRSRQG